MIRDVLVFTPVARLEAETVLALMGLAWDGAISFLLQRDNPSGDGVLDHLHQYQRGREAFLAGAYDGLLVIESDVVPPVNTLARLAAVDADVIYGAYMFRPSGQSVNICERYADPNARNVGEPLTVRGLWESAKKAEVVECSGAGLGCVLIHRHVVEAVPFRLEDGRPGYCDSVWTDDVFRAGYRMMGVPGVACDHIDVDGTVLRVP